MDGSGARSCQNRRLVTSLESIMSSILRRLIALAGVLAVFGVGAQTPAVTAPNMAQTTLRLIVPFTPGTGIDLIARTVGPRLGERLGRPVVVDNRAGASGNIGT